MSLHMDALRHDAAIARLALESRPDHRAFKPLLDLIDALDAEADAAAIERGRLKEIEGAAATVLNNYDFEHGEHSTERLEVMLRRLEELL